MALGKTIRVYLMDGTPSGPIVAEIINWTGRVIVIPRPQLHEMAKRSELQRTGIYALIGPDAESTRDRVYLGEADDVFERLKQHDKDDKKDFWTRAIAITSKDQNLTKAHGRYLESRLIEMTIAADRAALANGNEPATKTLPEPDQADMEYFLEQVQLVLPVLGFDFLRAQISLSMSQTINAERSPKFMMKEVGVEATAYEVNGVFLVQKGSTARRAGSPSWDSYITLRDTLLKDGKLIPKNNDFFEFSQDVEFSSPSAAAAVIAAANRNGRVTWRNAETHKTYAEWKESQLEAAEKAPGDNC